MKKIFAICFAAVLLASCNMDFYPSDSMTSDQLAANPAAGVYTTDGIYALFKDALAYKGESDAYPNGRNQYLRHYYQITELRSDNVTISGVTSDPFIHPYDYQEVPTEENIYYTWWLAYKIIYAANSNIAVLKPGASAESDHLLGENYFLRALGHFHMVTLFAMPYVYWKDHPEAMGVIEHHGMDTYADAPKRASIGDIYDHIVDDLKEAVKYLDGNNERASRVYVSADAARALLARVYLYMEENDKCIEVCDELMAHVPSAVTEGYDYAAYPTKTYDINETIWCIKPNLTDWFYTEHPQSSIGSMYYNDTNFKKFDGDSGWGEHYWSEELIELFQRYPQDKRFAAYFVQDPPAEENIGKLMVTFPIKTSPTNTYCSGGIVHGLTPSEQDGSITFTYNRKKYTAVPTVVNGYTQYIVEDKTFVSSGNSVQSKVYVRPDGNVRSNGGIFPIYYNTKFNGMEGKSNLTAPALLRWGEVVLNRAEAKAKKGDIQGALDDVNIIRRRAGLTGDAEMTSRNMTERGYSDVLDVVLDERRMELCFEGLRYFDVFRNRKNMDRRFMGFHEFGEIKWTDPRLAMLIPLDEINASGIPQNPR